MDPKPAEESAKKTNTLPEWSDQYIVEALARRVESYRLNPAVHRLTQHALDIDPVMRPVYRAARERDARKDKKWWTKWLIRAGLSPSEADRASCGRVHSRDTVVCQIADLYRQAISRGSWPGQEIGLSEMLRMRSIRAFGSAQSAREAALRMLGVKKPKKARKLRAAGESAARLVSALSDRLAKVLPLDKTAGSKGAGVSFTAIARMLRLSGWRRPGHAALSIEHLLFLALDQDPEVLGRLVRMAVKRAVRWRRQREGWCWKRWNPAKLKQPIWREEVEDVIRLLQSSGVPVGDLAEEAFLKGLPRRNGFLLSGWASGETSEQ